MCTPLAMGIASFAVGAAQAVAQYSAQKAEYKQNEANSIQAWKDQQAQITQREMQEQDALKQKLAQQNLEQAQAEADVEVSGAAAGVSGISLDNLTRDVARRAATNREIEQTNTDMIISQLKLERKGANSQAQSRINSVAKPSGLSLIAGIGSAAVSGVSSYTNYRNRMM